EGRPTAGPERERRRLERAVRARTLRTRSDTSGDTSGDASGDAGFRSAAFDLDALSTGLGELRLVELVEVDGVLHALVVAGRRVRRHTVGDLAEAEREVGLARFMLRRIAYGRGVGQATAALGEAGRRLQRVLLGPAVA